MAEGRGRGVAADVGKTGDGNSTDAQPSNQQERTVGQQSKNEAATEYHNRFVSQFVLLVRWASKPVDSELAFATGSEAHGTFKIESVLHEILGVIRQRGLVIELTDRSQILVFDLPTQIRLVIVVGQHRLKRHFRLNNGGS